jgi:redox-sensitive bicupin YhaK (pirin superfamily)
MLEIKSKTRKEISIGEHLYGESALYILEGGIESDGFVFEPRQLLVAKESTLCTFTILENSIVYLFGGMPFPEQRFIDWNFVASEIQTIREAKKKWNSGKWEKIPNDAEEFVPYPTLNTR